MRALAPGMWRNPWRVSPPPPPSSSAPHGALSPVDELGLLLRPAGGGVYLVSTGREEQLALQRRIYGAKDEAEVLVRFREGLARIATARAVVLGVPSDVGAGFLRGANMGPQALRTAMLKDDPNLGATWAKAGIVDVGDVFVVPQLLHDEMLSDAQIARSRAALYPNVSDEVRASLPVSPLSIAERALDLMFALNPRLLPVVLGGDHSNAWPVSSALARAHASEPWGIVQIDAHTDLLEERLGVRYCFATWSFHAAKLLARPDRMVQVGIRATRHPRAHWENTVGVRQVWADEVRTDPAKAIDTIVRHLHDAGVSRVYFSNDIDGTDIAFADATGTPEADGLHPDFVAGLIDRLGAEFGLLAGDVMEVAPPIPRLPGGTERTLGVAARYLARTFAALR